MYLKSVLSSLALSIVLILCYHMYHSENITVIHRDSLPTRTVSQYNSRLAPEQLPSFRKASQKVIPSVVSIATLRNVDGNQNMNYQSSSGSGVIVSEDGYIITNLHVVRNESNLKVVLNDRREFSAKIIGIDMETDLALIKVDATGLKPIHFISSDSAHIGDWVLAIGNPLELKSTVTAGIISAIERDINMNDQKNSIESFIQTDAVVSQGNSGGALINSDGDLIGIIAAMITFSGNYEGYSFAIPSDIVQKVYMDLKNYGSVSRGFIGIDVQNVDQALAQAKQLKKISGVLIDKITPGSAASESDLIQGDVILKINDRDIKSISEMKAYLALFSPGSTIKITYSRYGKIENCTLTLKNDSNNTLPTTADPLSDLYKIGLEVRNLNKEEQQRKLTGVRVVAISPGSKIARTQIKPEFIITKVDDKKVTSKEELGKIIHGRTGRVVLEGFYENQEGPFWYLFEM